MFSQYPSNDRWCSWLAALPDGHLLYTTASIVIGPLHSFPLNLKYHRLHPPEVSDLRFPWNETLSAVFDVSLLKVQSCERIIVKKTTILKKALVSHLSRMFMDVIYRVKSCKNKQTNKQTKKKTKNKNKNLRIYALREHHFIDYRISYGTGLGRGCKSTWYRLVNTNCYVLESITLFMKSLVSLAI